MKNIIENLDIEGIAATYVSALGLEAVPKDIGQGLISSLEKIRLESWLVGFLPGKLRNFHGWFLRFLRG